MLDGLPVIDGKKKKKKVAEDALPVVGSDAPIPIVPLPDDVPQMDTRSALPIVGGPPVAEVPVDINQVDARSGVPAWQMSGTASPLPVVGAEAPTTTPATVADDATSKAAQPFVEDQGVQTAYARYRDPNHRFDPETGERLPETKKHSVWSRIAAAAMGWAKGGLIGGIEAARNPHYWEDQHDESDRRAMLPQIQAAEKQDDLRTKRYAIDERGRQVREATKAKIDAATVAHQRSLEAIQARAKAEGKKLKELKADPDTGIVSAWYTDGTREIVPQIDASTGKPMVDPTTGNIIPAKDPNATLYDWVDPYTNQTVRIKGSEYAREGATIAVGNTKNELTAATTNVSNAMEVERRNTERTNTWAKETQSQLANIITAQGQIAAQVPAFGSLQTEFTNLNAELNALDPKDPNVATTRANIIKRYDAAMKKFTDAAGKSEAGQTLVKALQANMPPRPTMEKAPARVAASTVVIPTKMSASQRKAVETAIDNDPNATPAQKAAAKAKLPR